jgi:hypothetical protein
MQIKGRNKYLISENMQCFVWESQKDVTFGLEKSINYYN